MMVRSCWPACDYWNNEGGAAPTDAFWVEMTRQEAIESIFPHLNAEQRAESEQLAYESEDFVEEFLPPPRPFCFLVARDLSSIGPCNASYPYSPMWNAYSPFRPIPERTITSLQELKDISIDDDA